MTRSEHPARILQRLQTRARRNWGQHFLADDSVSSRIVALAQVGEGSRVLEVGPGLGALTGALMEAGAHLRVVERDPVLASHLRARHPGLAITEGDARRVDLTALCPDPGWTVAANLPYNVATPILLRLLAHTPPFQRLVVMVQREVGRRMVAEPGSRTYGALSLGVQSRATADLAAVIPPGAFHPRPKVDSALVVLVPHPTPRTGGASTHAFRSVVKMAFSQRRKTLRNALGATLGKDTAKALLDQAAIDPTLRAERLDLEAFGRLARTWEERPPREPER